MLVDASLQFPTVVFALGLCVALVYWVFVLLGALDIDLLGGGHHHLGDVVGSAKGGAEALKGVDADGGVWNGLGLGRVPLTISVSVILLVGWIGSLLLMHYVVPSISSSGWVPALVLPLVLIAAMVVAAVLVRPLAPVFAFREGKSNRDYVGHTCTISTGSVDEGFGQATVEDGGTVLVIPVRCDRQGKLARGDKALIIDFDLERQAYVVEPSAEMMAVGEGVRDPSERT